MEVRHLAQADRHISEGEHRVLVMERAIALAVGRGMRPIARYACVDG